MGYKVEHAIQVLFNKARLDELLVEKEINYTAFHKELVDKWGLDLKYGSFMNIISNKVESLLIYPYTIAEQLGVDVEELIEIKQLN
jgi:hypothetical protein